jgi:choline dehydrogenase-like flavoprotein
MTQSKESKNYDLLIVGAGMAGSILAARIAEKGVHPGTGDRLKVGLLEWGPYLKGNPRPGYGHPLRRGMFTNLTHDFRLRNHFSTPWGTGRLVGGSSMHFNAHAWRLLDVDYLHWQRETSLDWNAENFKDAVDEVQQMFNAHPVPEELLDPGQKLFVEAATKLGYSPQRMSHARRNCIHCGLGCLPGQMCRYDSKMSSLVTYIPIAEKEGVDIIPNTRVEKVILEKRGSEFLATGVWALQEDRRVRFNADKVLLSAGVHGTPRILYQSGYGPKDLLGEDLIVENAHVGQHVDGKLAAPGFPAFFPFRVKEGDRGKPPSSYFFDDAAPEGYDRLIFKDGSSDPELPDRMALSDLAPEFGIEHKKFMRTRGDSIAKQVVLQYNRPRTLGGSIQRDGSAVFLTNDPRDAQRLKEGMLIAREIYREMGATRISNIDPMLRRLDQVGPGNPEPSPIRVTHAGGSCRAGADRKNSVVNERFECHDIKNLSICDLSVPPRTACGSPGVAMVAPLACLAWRRLVKDHFSRS